MDYHLIPANQLRIGIDTGGTFTDLIGIEKNQVKLHKVPSTPRSPEEAVIKGLLELVSKMGRSPADVTQIIYGTTVGINALLEGKSPRTALITTKGFADVIEIGRQRRPFLYSLGPQPFFSLINKKLRLEVDERLDSHGNVIKNIEKSSITKIKNQIIDLNVKSVAISLLFSFLNPIHELEIRKALRSLNIHVSLSSDVAPIIREYERTVTTVMNALTTPVIQEYLERLEAKLRELDFKCKLQIIKSNAGIAMLQEIKRKAITTLLGGLAGGVMAGTKTSKDENIDQIITLDIGGTSCDVCTIENQVPTLRHDFQLAGYTIMSPALDVETIGAGGGSIAKVEAGLLMVGPESQGADPGPACYDKGGNKPTVTDANLVLGILDPNNFAGQEAPLNIQKAQKAIDSIAKELGLSLHDAALGIRRIMNNNMSHAIRKLTIGLGKDPRNYVLVPFGGAGPTHATDLALELHVPRVVVPPYPGIWSAMGILEAEYKLDFMQSILIPCMDDNLEKLKSIFIQLEEKALQNLDINKETRNKTKIQYKIALQYKGQGYNLTIPISNLVSLDLTNLRHEFDTVHQKKYQWHDKDRSVIIIDAWVTISRPMLRMRTVELKEGNAEPDAKALIEERETYLGREEFASCSVYDRTRLLANNVINGPAIIQQMDTTTFIPPGVTGKLSSNGYISIDINPLLSESKGN